MESTRAIALETLTKFGMLDLHIMVVIIVSTHLLSFLLIFLVLLTFGTLSQILVSLLIMTYDLFWFLSKFHYLNPLSAAA